MSRKEAAMLNSGVVTDYDDLPDNVLANIPGGDIDSPTEMLRQQEIYGITPVNPLDMDEENYRNLLKYKIALNTSNGTYDDIMMTLNLFWSLSPVKYSERVPAWKDIPPPLNIPQGEILPATMKIDAGEFTHGTAARAFFLLPIIKAAGVTLLRSATTVTELEPTEAHIKGAILGTIMTTTLPQLPDFEEVN
jgi:hypothetical protein